MQAAQNQTVTVEFYEPNFASRVFVYRQSIYCGSALKQP